ncbi:MAG: FHA domain-containing protein [Candidatus Brocadiia bacterium]
MAKLIDQRTGEERQLVKAVTLIGRAEYCDVCVRDRVVSREHARIRRRLTGCYIEDLGSTHGTRVNDVRIGRRVKLRDGDVIVVGLVRPPQARSTEPRRPHTDTTLASERTPPPGAPLGPSGSARVGATFVFRK